MLSTPKQLSNVERYNKLKESRERARLKLATAQQEIGRLEAELKMAKMQQDSGAEGKVGWRPPFVPILPHF